jgi:quinol monooxygenase YgiN
MKPDNRSGELLGVAIFEDRASYTANADNPEQHAWFTKMRDLLEADPEWEDGEYVAGSLS